MNRIEKRLTNCREKNEKAMITYITAGLPSLEKTVEIVKTQAGAGVDVIELGVPFSDPIADGPVIQAASYRSILNGTTVTGCLDTVKEIRKDCEVPIVFMMYYNTVLHFGVERFVEKCKEVGVDGLIIPDLPYEEEYEIKEYLTDDQLFLIPLVSPVSKGRIPMLLKDAKGFVYCVSSMGVTGQGAQFHSEINQYLNDVKNQTKLPVMMGFGIQKASDVKMQKETIDGAIVGSALIRLCEENDYDLDIITNYITTFKKEMNSL